MHHGTPPSGRKQTKWCTACTDLNWVDQKTVQIGALGAPFRAALCWKPLKMVHHVHQEAPFSEGSPEKWCTRCTILGWFWANAIRNGARSAPPNRELHKGIRRMVHKMHHPAPLSIIDFQSHIFPIANLIHTLPPASTRLTCL